MEERERVYGAEPEVKNWIKKKKMIFRFMAAYWILHAVLSIAALQQMGAGFQVVTPKLPQTTFLSPPTQLQSQTLYSAP